MEFGPKDALEKLRKYCAYQERSHKDAHQKMWDLGIPSEWKDDILLALIQENFLNEERFARTYAHGKFSIKKWGRIKIVHGLKQHNVQKKCIQIALNEIDEDAYLQTLTDIIELKNSKLKEKNHWKRKHALYRFATQRGFEPELVNEVMARL